MTIPEWFHFYWGEAGGGGGALLLKSLQENTHLQTHLSDCLVQKFSIFEAH